MTAPPPGPQKVAIVTGASRGIGEGISAAFVRAGYAVVATSRSIHPSDRPDVLAVSGGIGEAETAARLPALIADCTLVPVEGGPHNIGWTHPDEVNSALLEFITAKVPVTA